MLSKYETKIKRAIDKLFEDPALVRTISYTVFKGRTSVQTFPMTAICTVREIGSSGIQDRVQGQSARRVYVIREIDLPSGITVDSLTRNDRISDGGEFSVTGISKALEFIIEVQTEGAV